MEHKVSILIVDDERSVRLSLYHWFVKEGYAVATARDAYEALSLIQKENFNIILADIKMPGMDGLEMNRRIQKIEKNAVVIIMTAFASVDTAVIALKDGAYDYITKPFDPEDLSKLIRKISTQILMKAERRVPKARSVSLENIDDIIGESDAMVRVLRQVEKIAMSDSPVLITGEKGTGKELIAQAIHINSSRRYFDLQAAHCGALSGVSAESALIGHEKGALPGALDSHKGYFEAANGGTLLLDEISGISPRLQLDLLRIIESKTFTRIGSEREITADFRLICTTRENLKKRVMNQQFREDLYYRLNIAHIHLPPLRERREDIPLLTDHFVGEYCTSMSREKLKIAPDAMLKLQKYDFPGNVRELENMIERAILLSNGKEIKIQDLPFGDENSEPGFESLEDHEKKYIRQILNSQKWNISKSARILKVDRVTLYNKIKKYALEQPG